MALSYASNAIFSKARAMYGKRLKPSDYERLLACDTVPEILSCLKTIPKYAQIMSKLSERDIHRVQLEAAVRQKLFEDYEVLCRYEITVGEDFSDYTIMRAEMEQIMRFVTMLKAGTPQQFYMTLPKYFHKVSSFNITEMSKATNYDEFLKVLGKSNYAKLLAPFKPKKGEEINLADIENALFNYMFKRVYSIIEKTSGAEKKDLKSMFDVNIDLRNFSRILRLKQYYKMEPDEIRKQLLPFGSLRERHLQAMCNAEDEKEVYSIMQQTPAGKILSKIDYSSNFEITRKALYEESYKRMYFSVNPSVVLVAYFSLAEAETNNIIHIIEGVRYHVSDETVRKLLIYK